MDLSTGRSVCRSTDRVMDGWIDGWMDGGLDGKIGILTDTRNARRCTRTRIDRSNDRSIARS
eukprot:7637716-Lingulodinium_polyedra.AAC.1